MPSSILGAVVLKSRSCWLTWVSYSLRQGFAVLLLLRGAAKDRRMVGSLPSGSLVHSEGQTSFTCRSDPQDLRC